MIECVANPPYIRAYLSFNDLTTNIRSKEVSQECSFSKLRVSNSILQASKILLSNTRGSYRNGRLSCQTTYAIDDYKNEKIPGEERWRIVDINNRAFYFFFVRGDADVEGEYGLWTAMITV